MKRALFILTLGLALAAGGYAGLYFAATAPGRAEMSCAEPELAWLKREFSIDDSEFAKISRMHEAYLPECAARCRVIQSKNAELTAIIAKTGQLTPDIEKRMNEIAQLRADCAKETLRHFLAVSRAMPPAQGQRYLSWALDQTFPCHGSGMNTNAGCHSMAME